MPAFIAFQLFFKKYPYLLPLLKIPYYRRDNNGLGNILSNTENGQTGKIITCCNLKIKSISLEMNYPALSPATFYLWKARRTIVDLRSAPAFRKGSIPGAISLPEENFHSLTELTERLKVLHKECPVHLVGYDQNTVVTVATELNLYYLEGGYTCFREWREEMFSKGLFIALLSGKTGSGKTETLQLLKQSGFQTIDLEALAMHKGSVFGNLEAAAQPTHEDFHNRLLEHWLALDSTKVVWLEEKNHALGSVGLPDTMYRNMLLAPMVELVVPYEQRLQHILQEYAGADKEVLKKAIRSIEARTGMSANHKALHYLSIGQMDKCFQILLNYYDRAYEHRREQLQRGVLLQTEASLFAAKEAVHRLEEKLLALYKKRDLAD